MSIVEHDILTLTIVIGAIAPIAISVVKRFLKKYIKDLTYHEKSNIIKLVTFSISLMGTAIVQLYYYNFVVEMVVLNFAAILGTAWVVYNGVIKTTNLKTLLEGEES